MQQVHDIEDLAQCFREGKNDHFFTDEEVSLARKRLVEWYLSARRALPWRGDPFGMVQARSGASSALDKSTKEDDETLPPSMESESFVTPPQTPYGTWCSEIMLQQTRVETVIPYWYRWMQKYPNISALAAASPEDVNSSWAGLGYYRRARQLHLGAQQLVAEAKANGKEPHLPDTVVELLKVPGIGAYTAGAISSIAFNKPEPLVDGNVIRVFSRLRMLTSEVGSKDMEKRTWEMARRLVDPQAPSSFNQGLMELGASLCKPQTPSCEQCPLSSLCRARTLTHLNRQAGVHYQDDGVSGLCSDGLPKDLSYFPVRAPKKKPREVVLFVSVFVRECEDGVTRYLFIKRPPTGLLAGQWELPTVLLWEESSVKSGKGSNKAEKKNDGASEMMPLYDSQDDLVLDEAKHTMAVQSFLERVSGCRFEKSANHKEGIPQFWISALQVKDEALMEPIEPIVHVFSHQRHTMHITVMQVDCVESVKDPKKEAFVYARESRWMSSEEITNAGITSGCKKVLSTVQKSLGKSVDKNSRIGNKRAKPIKETTANPKKLKLNAPKMMSISSFFLKK